MKHTNGESTNPICVKLLSAAEQEQLVRLENGFLVEIGEEPMDEKREKALCQAVREEKIHFFVALDGQNAVGMCSVATCFSTFTCGEVGSFEDFYVVPAFRGRGIARLLARTAQRWCLDHEILSLSVTCAPCDEAMYKALGFQTPLGKTYAYCKE